MKVTSTVVLALGASVVVVKFPDPVKPVPLNVIGLVNNKSPNPVFLIMKVLVRLPPRDI